MIIGIDIDDVIADYMGAIIARLKEAYGITITNEQWDRYWLEDHPLLQQWKDPLHQVHEQIFYDGTMSRLEAYPDAKAVLLRLCEDHQILFVTARGVKRSNVALSRKHTLTWLKAQGIPFHGLHFEHEKDLAAKRLGIDVFIEDNPANAEAVLKSGIPVIVMDQAYNRSLSGKDIIRVHDWNEIEKAIKMLARKSDTVKK